MSLLIIGATGTLGRQIALQASLRGYPIRCMVRDFQNRNISFLKEWGAELVYGDLTRPETLPPCFKGITTIIDASTSRVDEFESLKKVDWDGKIALIEAAQAANIRRYVFFSIKDVEQFKKIPLMKLKYGIEKKLEESKIPYTIFRLTAFYQGLIVQYALPLLEKSPVLVTRKKSYIPYMDSRLVSKFVIRSLQMPKTINKTFSLSGLKGWSSSEIIEVCEKLSGQTARVVPIPLFIFKLLRDFFGFFESGQNISYRLAFVELVEVWDTENSFSKSTRELYEMFKFNPDDINEVNPLDDYFLEYFLLLLKAMNDIDFEDAIRQKDLMI